MCKHIHLYHYKTFIYLKCKKNHDLEKGEENKPMGVKTGTSLLWFEKLLGWNLKKMFNKIKIFFANSRQRVITFKMLKFKIYWFILDFMSYIITNVLFVLLQV